jgi:hypothetical protein
VPPLMVLMLGINELAAWVEMGEVDTDEGMCDVSHHEPPRDPDIVLS